MNKTKKIFLDDVRLPADCIGYMYHRIGKLNPIYLEEWLVVRNYDEFVKAIEEHIDEITHVSFDHDLADIEDWEKIKGFEDYSVSTKGSVRRDRISRGTSGGLMKLYHHSDTGSITATLCKNSIHYRKLVHVLVAEAFIPNPENKPQVNHKDGNRSHNWVNNLEWNTQSENIQHAHDNLPRNYTSYGSNHRNSKSVTQYSLNGIELDTFGGVNEAGRQLKCPFTNIAKCARGERHTAAGFIWKYEGKPATITEEIIKLPKKVYTFQPYIEKTGCDAAKWMKQFYEERKVKLPIMFVHSANPVGTQNIINVFK